MLGLFGRNRNLLGAGRKSRIQRTRDDQSGSVAVEFSVVVIPFMMIILSIMEVGWYFFVNTIVDDTIASAGRLLRTGRIQQVSTDPAEQEAHLRDFVCGRLGAFGNCSTLFTYDVRAFSSFSEAVDHPNPGSGESNPKTSDIGCPGDDEESLDALQFDPGTESQFIRVRFCVTYETLNPAIGVNLSQTDNGRRNIQAVFFLKTETFLANNANSASTPPPSCLLYTSDAADE